MHFPVTAPLVKKRLERSAERDKREIKNEFSAEDAQSNAEGILNRPNPAGFLQLFVRKSGCNDLELWLNRRRIFLEKRGTSWNNSLHACAMRAF